MSYFDDDQKKPITKENSEKLKEFDKTFSFSDNDYFSEVTDEET